MIPETIMKAFQRPPETDVAKRYDTLSKERKAWAEEKAKAHPDAPIDGFIERHGKVVPARLLYLSEPTESGARWEVEGVFVVPHIPSTHVWPTEEGVVIESLRHYAKRVSDAWGRYHATTRKLEHWAAKYYETCA